MKKKFLAGIATATMVAGLLTNTCFAQEVTKIYVDAGHGCKYTSSESENPYGFTSTGAEGEALYAGGFANHLINSFNHTDRYEAVGISALTHPDGTVGDREIFGNSGRRELFVASDYDIMIQIHYDFSQKPEDTGGHVIWSKNSKDSGILAYKIAKAMEDNGLRLCERVENHISERNELTIYQEYTDKPIILIEVGFGTENQLDHDYIRDKPTKRLFYKSIIEGTDAYLAYKNTREGEIISDETEEN